MKDAKLCLSTDFNLELVFSQTGFGAHIEVGN